MTPPELTALEIKAFVPSRDFTLFDSSGVLWRIAQNTPRQAAAPPP